MPINSTIVLRHIKRRLGAAVRILELSDENIIETVVQETLPTFSNYYPHMMPIEVNTVRDLVDRNDYGKYFLRTEFEILGIAKLLRGESAVLYKTVILNNTLNMFDNQIINDMLSSVNVPSTFNFLPPNKIEVFPKYVSEPNFLAVLKVIHPSHFYTVPMSLRDEFLKLALYDVAMSILAIRKQFTNLNSPFGNIELNMDDLESAEDKRNTLIDEWDHQYYKEGNRRKIWIM